MMMTRLITFTILLTLLGSCANQSSRSDAGLETDEISVAEFIADASPFVEKPVKVMGAVVHVCRHGGQRLFIVGENSEDQVRITTGKDIAEFEVALEGNQIEVQGIVRELIIDDTYLAEWEMEVIGGTEQERGEGHMGGVGHMEHAGMGEVSPEAAGLVSGELGTEAQKEATLKRIQSIREEITASGQDHLSDYWIETVSFKVLDTGQED
jgi:hypothetical protein